jgi:hypothetical protein
LPSKSIFPKSSWPVDPEAVASDSAYVPVTSPEPKSLDLTKRRKSPLKACTTAIDMALEGQTRLPQPGGIVKRQWVPPAIKTVSNAARSDSGSESGDSVTVDTTINAEVLA